MKRAISFILSLIMVVGICTSMPFAKIEAGAVTGSDLFTVKTSGVENGKITYTVYLNAGVKLSGSVVYAKFDSSVLSVNTAKSGVFMVDDGVGGERENIDGLYDSGFMIGYNNQFSIVHLYGQSYDYSVGSSNEPYICFTFDFIDNSYPETFVEFYCYEFISKSVSKNNIENGSSCFIASVSSLHTHSYSDWVIEKEATCTENGNKYKICSACDDKKDVTVIDAIGHNYSEWFIENDATCTENGSQYKICANCDDIITSEAIATGHNFVNGVCTFCEITSTAIEYLTFKLNNDGKSYSVMGCDTAVSGQVVIPSKYNGKPVTSITANAFRYCEKLEAIVIPDGVTSIGDNAFRYCEKLETIEIPDSVTSIGKYAFHGCGNIAAVYISDVSAWCDISFSNGFSNPLVYTKKLYVNDELVNDLVIPEGVVNIKPYAFYSCESLISIVIPNSVLSIGDYAFDECQGLDAVYISDVSAWCNINFSNYLSNPLLYANELYVNNELVNDLVIPEGVVAIKPYAFYHCKSLTSVVIPNSVLSIDEWAFYGCENLESIEIPNGVTTIGDYAFYCCCKAVVSLPQSITSIGVDAFDCSGEHYDDFEDFAACFVNRRPFFCFKDSYAHEWLNENGYKYALIDGTLEETTEGGKIGAHTWSLNKLTGALVLNGSGKMIDFTTVDAPWYDYCAFVTDINLPHGLTNIGKKAFSGLYRVENVVIPDSVTIIDEYAFSGCYGIESMEIPSNVVSIGESAFRYCERLESIVIPDGVTGLKDYVFYGCSSLTSVEMPNSLTSIGRATFGGCRSLALIKIPDSVTSIDYEAFWFCTELTSITIGAGVSDIARNVFDECWGLKQIKFALNEDNVSLLTDMPEISDTSIKSVFLPASISYASSYVFPSDIETVTVCNPELLFDSCCGLNYNSTIIGFKGSTAESFASDIGATFIDIETVHTHNYKFFEEKGYCSFGRCICGKENAEPHEDGRWITDVNASCEEDGSQYKICTECEEIIETGVIPAIGHTSSDWITDKKATTSSAGKKVKKCTECGETLETATIKQLKASKPKLSKIENTSSGVKITWGKVSGADKYRVYRKTSGGSYSKIGTTTKTYYTDKEAKSGKKYYYVVKAVNEAGSSDSSSSKSILHLADPTFKTPSSTSKGVVLKWNKITGASGYYVYRKTGSGSYKKIATVKGKTKVTYTDKSAKKGKKYTYKVKAYYSKTTSAYSNTKTIKDKY